MADSVPRGLVYLVGAGPGDPGLLTLRGAECLARADVVLYDYLANPDLLRHCRTTAELICLGRHGRTRIWPQEEINRELVRHALAGKTVVRLKGGDPGVFARVAEEAEALAAAGVPFEVAPGITAALSAGTHAGIPITHRELASAVAFVTGHEQEHKGEAALDYAPLANFPGTLVFYMGVTTAPAWSAALIAGGKSPDTPAAIVRHASLPDQQTLVTTLADVPAALAAARLRPPVVVIVGEVVRLRPLLGWFERRPLFGQTVLVTRPADQAEDLRRPLAELGAEVLTQPAIEIGPPADWAPVDAAIARLAEFDWVVFSSGNGVRHFLGRLEAKGRDLRQLGRARLAAIGPGTAEALREFHLRADLVPAEFRAEALAAALAEGAKGQRFLLVRASRGREVLAEELTQAGGRVEQVVAYRSQDVAAPDAEIAQRLAAGGICWITVTSSAIAQSLARLFGDDLRRARLASISPITSETLRGLGFQPAAEASQYTMAGVVAALREAASRSDPGSAPT